MSKSIIKITLTFLFSIKMIALYVFVADEQLFKQSVFSISSVYIKIFKKKYLVIQVYFTSCVRGRAGRPKHKQHDCHHDTKVKPEAATAVIELLMMGGKNARNMLSCE
jgi:hypothetical protein